jgi:hypothetical protein
VNSARGMQALLPSSASSMVPTDSPARLDRSEKLRTCRTPRHSSRKHDMNVGRVQVGPTTSDSAYAAVGF